MGRVLVLGSLNVDLVTRVERHLMPGETVTGEGLHRRAGGRGVPGAPTGRALIAVADDGENTIVVVPGAKGLLDDTEVAVVDGLGPGDVLLLQLEAPRRVVSAAARRAAARVARVVGRGVRRGRRRAPPAARRPG